MKQKQRFIPAARISFLTDYFDRFCAIIGLGRKYREKIIRAIGVIRKGSKVLDAGCGTGSLAIELKNKYNMSKIYGVDIDKKILKIAKKKSIKNKVNIFYQQAPLQSMPYPDSYFDVVYSSLVFHHLTTEDKITATKEIYRVLRKGGFFILADFGPSKNKFSAVYLWFVVIFEDGYDNYKGFIPKFLRATGFKDIKIVGNYRFNIDFLRAGK